MSLFAAHDLTCLRGGSAVLAGVSLTVMPGEVAVLRGPNGSGKTTLLRTFSGLQPPARGRIEGQDRCAYASHLDGVKAALTVSENLRFWSRIFGQTYREQVLHDFALYALRHRPAGTLSAGQSRRLGLARLALSGRAVWLMDEPTVSLDSGSVARFVEAVMSHCTTGGAAIIASHLDLGFGSGAPGPVLEMEDFAPTAASTFATSDEHFL